MHCAVKIMCRRLTVVAAMATIALISTDGRAADGNAPDPGATPPQAPAPQPPAPLGVASLNELEQPSAPLGIFGANLPGQGHLVVGVAPFFNKLDGSLIGSQSVSQQYAVTHVYTNYAPGLTTHVVRNDPQDVEIWGVPFGASYGLTKDVALTVSSIYLDKHQDVTVFKGMSGTAVQGTSHTGSSGFGDTAVVGAWRVYHDSMNQVNLQFGMFLPTGSATVDATALTNSGIFKTGRAVYTLQLGTGTFDALPGVVYSGFIDNVSWGASYRGRLPLDKNSEGYRWGNYNEFNVWAGYSWLPKLETSLRFSGSTQGQIVGYDPKILGYGPCSNPDWFGGQHIDMFPGVTVGGRYFGVPAATAALEFGVPLYQDLNGLHTARDYSILTGIKYKI